MADAARETRRRTRSWLANHRKLATTVDSWIIGLVVALLAGCAGATLDDAGLVDAAADEAAPEGGDPVAGDDPAAVLDAVADALDETDLDRLVQLSTGAAAVYFTHVRHVYAATGDDAHLFDNLTVDLERPVIDGGVARADGVVGYGTAEGAPPRILTDWWLRETGDGWRIAGFTRNDEPVEAWTVPGDPTASVRDGEVEVAVVALFVDAGCFTGRDAGCPAAVRDSFAVDLMVTNDTGGDLAPAPVALPDGAEVPAYVDTGAGTHPVVEADAPGFPSGASAEVIAVFGGASELGEGATLHLAFETASGELVPFAVPLPAYPHDW